MVWLYEKNGDLNKKRPVAVADPSLVKCERAKDEQHFAGVGLTLFREQQLDRALGMLDLDGMLFRVHLDGGEEHPLLVYGLFLAEQLAVVLVDAQQRGDQVRLVVRW
jgi:hypothetical protein